MRVMRLNCHVFFFVAQKLNRSPSFSMTRILHDSPKKNRFIGAVQGGNPVPIAAASFRIPRSTGYKLWNKYKTMGSTHALPRSGRPPVVTPHLKRRVAHEIRKDRKAHFQEIGQLVKPTISATTVQAIADENGIHRHIARKVPFLRPDVTGKGHKTRSALKRGLSRLELSIVNGQGRQRLCSVFMIDASELDCPQRQRRLNLGSPQPKSRLLSTGNPTMTKRP